MKKFKTWEIVKMYQEGNLKSGQRLKTSSNLDNLIVTEKCLQWEETDEDFTIDRKRSGYEWELIQQPVSVTEAAKAYIEGKTVASECRQWGSRTYKPDQHDAVMRDQQGKAVTAEEILEGIWYIKEDSNE